MKHFLPLALFVLCSFSARAQTPAPQPSDLALQKCILLTDEGTWNALKLSSDQLGRVRNIQQACAEECKASDVKKPQDSSMIKASGTTVVSELKSVLTPEQYATWVDRCAAHDADAPAPK